MYAHLRANQVRFPFVRLSSSSITSGASAADTAAASADFGVSPASSSGTAAPPSGASASVTFSTSAHGASWLSSPHSPGFELPHLRALWDALTTSLDAETLTGADALLVESIDRDVSRTLSASVSSAALLARLRRVLIVFAVYERSVGYTQGLNFLVAFLLLHVESEAEAFALLVRLMNDPRFGMAPLFQARLRGVSVTSRVLDELIARFAPRAARRLARARVGALMFFEWYFTLFTLVLPPASCAALWDVIFRDGFAPTAHRAVVVLVRALEPALERARDDHSVRTALKSFARARAAVSVGITSIEAEEGVLAAAIAAAEEDTIIDPPSDLVHCVGLEEGITIDLIRELTEASEQEEGEGGSGGGAGGRATASRSSSFACLSGGGGASPIVEAPSTPRGTGKPTFSTAAVVTGLALLGATAFTVFKLRRR